MTEVEALDARIADLKRRAEALEAEGKHVESTPLWQHARRLMWFRTWKATRPDDPLPPPTVFPQR